MLNMQVGNLVQWFDYYHDGIVKSAGVGIIIDERIIKLDGSGEGSTYHQYLVSISRKLDSSCTVWFESHELDLL